MQERSWESMNKFEDLLNAMKLGELMSKREQEEKKHCTVVTFFAIIGAVAAVATIAYAVYKHFTPDYLEDFDEDEYDDYDDEDFDDDVVEFSTSEEDDE